MCISSWLNVCSRWWAFRAVSHQQSCWKCGKKFIHELIHESCHQTIHPLSHMVAVSCIVCQEILTQIPEHALSYYEVCHPDSWHWILMCALSFLRWLMMTYISSLGSSHEMKFGFKATIWRLNNSCSSGKACCHQAQRRFNRSGVQQKAYPSFFFFNAKAIIHEEFVPSSSTRNSGFY